MIAEATPDFPAYQWLGKLAASVTDGISVWLPLGAGNGAEDIAHRLGERCPNAQVVEIDLTNFDQREFVLDYLQKLVDGEIRSMRSERTMAAALAGDRDVLTLVIVGAGGYVREHGKEEFGKRFREFEKLRGLVSKPVVVLVLVSPVPLGHLLPFNPLSGSRTSLQSIIVEPEVERDILESWARVRMQDWPKEAADGVLRESHGQHAAMVAGLRNGPAAGVEAVIAQHRNSADVTLFKFLGSCCGYAIRGKLVDDEEGCARVLHEANLTKAVDGAIVPVIPHWAEVWAGKRVGHDR